MHQVPEKVPGPVVGKFLCHLKGVKGVEQVEAGKKVCANKKCTGGGYGRRMVYSVILMI